MRPVSQRFLDTLRGSHRMVARARVCAPGQSGVNPTGVEIPILAGNVQLDAAADVRGTLELETYSTWPTLATDTLMPYGNEVFVERGVVYGDGVREWVGLGYYRINQVEQQEAPRGRVRLSCTDRMQGVIDGRTPQPVIYQAGGVTLYGLLSGAIFSAVGFFPVIVSDMNLSTILLPRTQVLERDVLPFLKDLAQSYGRTIYWGYDGKLYFTTTPDPRAPVWSVNEGAGGVLVKASRSVSRTGVYNGVVAMGESSGDTDPIRAVSTIESANDPLRWGGPFGKVPRFYSSSLIVTQEQAQSAAAAMLQRVKGLPYAVSFEHIPNPALEVGDAVTVVYGSRTELHVLDKLSIPLGPGGTMQATTRAQNADLEDSV